MTFQDIAALRLSSQHISPADLPDAASVVRHMVAMQAQDYPGALWSIGLRTPHLTKDMVEQAILNKTIVRTWPMRGTLHFVAAEDLRWLVALLAPRATAAAASRRRQLELDDATIARAKEVVIKALNGNNCLTRNQLCELFDQNGISSAGQRGIHLLRYFSEQGLICFGPHDGKQPTFVLVDEWLPPTPIKDKDEALGELATRYFASHGPAHIKDFAGWGNMTIGDAKRGIEVAGSNLLTSTVEGTAYWHTETSAPPEGQVNLLPGFDEFMLGYKDRTPSLAPEFSDKIVPGGNGMFLPTLVIDGVVRGTWKKTQRRSGQTLTITPFTPVAKKYHPAIDQAIKRYGEFCDLPTDRRFES